MVFLTVLTFPLCFYFLLSPSGQKNIPAHRGDTVLLPCQAPSNTTIGAVEWTKDNLEKRVFLARDGHPSAPRDQDPSFVNRTVLADSQMKDGNLSLILKNVSIEDMGTYECHVIEDEGNHSKGASIFLNVTDPGESGSLRISQITLYRLRIKLEHMLCNT